MMMPMSFTKRTRRGVAVTIVLAAAMVLAAVPMACAPAGGAGGAAGSAKSTSSKPSQIPEVGADAPGRATAAISGRDPCAERLHAVCGPLLFYYALHRRMPEKLDELRAIAAETGEAELEFTCPVSGRPYIYVPQGVPRGKGQPGLLVLFDATPAHSGLRWAVAVDVPRPGQPLVSKIVAEPETTFHTE
jgi:hypothetical protein